MKLKKKHPVAYLTAKNSLLVTIGFFTLATTSYEAYAKVKAVNFVAGVIRKHDDNLFKTANNTESDNITSVYAGLKVDKTISLQRFTGTAIITKRNFSNNDQLNYVGKNFDATWHWALTRRLTGKLSADRVEVLNNFNDTRNTNKNVRVNQNQRFLADFNPSGGWHYLAGISRQTLENSAVFNQDNSYTANAVDLGLRYDFPSSSTITLMHHARKGKFDDRDINPALLFDDRFKEHESELLIDWSLTVKSRILAGTSYLKREHDNFSQRDYSGLQGFIAYDWKPTSRIDVGLKAASRLASFQTSVDSYTRNNGIVVTSTYKLTPKTRMKADLNFSKRNFLGSGYNPQVNSSRRDDFRSAGIGIEWKPTQGSAIEFGLSRYRLNSNDNVFDYKGNAATLSGEIEF